MSTHRIAVVGENLVDLLVAPGGEVKAVVGGGPFNVARAIGRLGGEVHFFTGVSDDAFGSFVRDSLEESGVHLVFERPFTQPTTVAVVELNGAGPRYHFHLNDTAAFSLDPRETLSALEALGELDALYVGTLGLVVEPMASLSEAVVDAVAGSTLVVLDPNCRPSAVRDHDAYRSRVRRLCARADIVKVSTEDVAYLYPGQDPLGGARALADLGAGCVVVTDGPAAVRALVGGSVIAVPVAPVSLVDTVGAGDSLVGGLMRWWTGHDYTREDVHDPAMVEAALRAAVDVSRLTCERAGAQSPLRDEQLSREGWRWL